MKFFRFLKRNMSLYLMAAIVSVFTLLVYNIPFFEFAVQHSGLTPLPQIFLVFSLVVVMLVVNFLAVYLLVYLLRYAGRALVAIALICNAAGVYFVKVYNVFLDDSMMSNFFNTRTSEAMPFITWKFVLWVVIMGLLPAVYVLVQKLDYGKIKQFGIWIGSALGVTLLMVLLNFNRILWFGQYDTELGGLLMPWSYTVNSCRLLSQHRQATAEEKLLPDGTFLNDEKTAVVLVIGESARKANFSLYGYERPTNPCLAEVNDLHVFEAHSCATYTTAGVKAMLEYKSQSALYEILPNYLYRHGADVVWRTSNWGEPPVHIDEYVERKQLKKQYPEFADNNYDGLLFCGLKERIVQSDKNKVLIVIHTSTSHGPCYYSQYPERFSIFTPVCENVEEGRKAVEGVINAYDNSILYTDAYLSDLIDTLRTLTDWQCAMFYVSDHGESLGENGLFMHGVPINMAPREQYEIPFLVWTSDNRSMRTFQQPIEQHYIYHSVLHYMGLKSEIYDPEKDIFAWYEE